MLRFIKIMICLLFVFLMGCTISVDVETLDFGSTETTKTFNLTVVGKVKWTISPSEPWVTVSPNQGEATDIITVSVERAGLGEGNYTAELNIDTTLKLNTPVIIVEMTVEEILPSALVEGYVLDADTDDPLSGAIVSIGVNSDTSDASGYYEVDAGLPGLKTITASKEGYEDYTEDVEVGSGTNLHDIYMNMTHTASTTTTASGPGRWNSMRWDEDIWGD